MCVLGSVTYAAHRRRSPALRRWRSRGGPVAAALRIGGTADLERLGAYNPEENVAQAGLAAAQEAGFERLLREHREAWAQRWREADVVIEGDPELQRAVRFALFHLMASVGEADEAAVGARGLSGGAYRGHVFWDSDVFVLPFLAATHPVAARAMLEYRVRRLPAAREPARTLGRSGARFAWESARDGSDVTPASARLATGELVPIRTGELEEHIVGDVAWAAACYLAWTGDEAFAAGPGRDLIVETARYWASRVRYGRDGRAHIYGVVGPDEYHEPVDDNAFTNVLARWNLRQAAALDGVDEARANDTGWRSRTALIDGYDRASGLYEQFAGFFELEPLVIEEIAPRRPIAADLLLGAERTAGAQVLKQADVLMLHHLLPDETAPGSLVPNLDFYEPRTAHGSSLSPAINASVLARAGRYRPALQSLRDRSPHGPRRSDRQHGGRTAPGDDGRPVAGARVRIRRHPPSRRCTARRSSAAEGVERPRVRAALPGRPASAPHRSQRRDRHAGRLAGPADKRAMGGDSEMKKVLAALDNSLAGKSLLAAASTFATLLGAEVEALHVRTDGERTARNTADAAGIRLRATTGPVVERLVEAGRASDVVALAIGAR